MYMSCRASALAGGLLLSTCSVTWAADPVYQSYFFTVCGGTTSGALAARCAQTPGGLGNLSGDSESSLVPSQSLSHNLVPISAAQTRSKASRERTETLRTGTSVPTENQAGAVQVGPFSLLVNAHGTWFERTAPAINYGERQFDGDSRALEVGFDYRGSPRFVTGLIVGIERNDYRFNAENPGVAFTPASSAGAAEGDKKYLTAFASATVGAKGFLDVSAGYERGDSSFTRNSVFQESTRTIAQTNVRTRGDTNGDVLWFTVNAGLNIDRGALSFGPFAGLTYGRAQLDAFAEQDLTNSGLAMNFAAAERRSLLAHAGVRVSYAASTAVGVLMPQLRVEYQHELENNPGQVAASFLLDPRGTTFQQTAIRGDASAINAGFGVAAILPNGWMPFLEYTILLGNDALDRQRATIGLRVEF